MLGKDPARGAPTRPAAGSRLDQAAVLHPRQQSPLPPRSRRRRAHLDHGFQRQALRRSWRIGQTEPVKVVFMAYRNALQADALTLVAQKLQSSLAVEGELPEDGLTAHGDDGDDLMLVLARKLVSGEQDSDTDESVFEWALDQELSVALAVSGSGLFTVVGVRRRSGRDG